MTGVATPSTAKIIAELQERRREEAHERARIRLERESQIRQEFIARSGLSHDALVTTYRTLRELSKIDISDLVTPPGFNLLDDGSVSSINADTPEWQQWSQLDQLKQRADDLFHVLINASDELKVAGHWDSEASS